MKQELQEYFKDVFQKHFDHEFLDAKVSFPVPHHANVRVRVKSIRPEITALARALELEFAELDRLINVEVMTD